MFLDIDYFYVIKQVAILVALHDIMDWASYDRKRDKGFFSIHRDPDLVILGVEFRFDVWHTAKQILYAWLFYEWFGFTYDFLLACVLNFVLHEHILFHGIFKRWVNNE